MGMVACGILFEETVMANHHQQPAEPHDDEHWAELGKRVHDPEAAALIVSFLNGHPQLRAKHGGLFLLATEVLHRDKVKRLKEAMENRSSRRLARILSNFVEHAIPLGMQILVIGFRCFRLGWRLLLAAMASGQNQQTKRQWRFATVSFNTRSYEPQEKPSWSRCGGCGSPVGMLQQRCDECGHVLRKPQVLPVPAKA